MKRSLIAAVAIGIVATVAHSWYTAAFTDQSGWTVPGTQVPTPERWPSYLERLDWPPPSDAARYQFVFGSSSASRVEISGGYGESDRLGVSLEVREFGLPLRALKWEVTSIEAGPGAMAMAKAADSAAGIRTGISLGIDTGDLRKLPVIPMWPGFLVNTAVFAFFAYASAFSFRRFRRFKRRRRGLCTQCCQDLRIATGACSECGARQ